ncbi:MAG: hypothetical protein WA432_00485 [Candidatus Babeliaceae bacterium]
MTIVANAHPKGFAQHYQELVLNHDDALISETLGLIDNNYHKQKKIHKEWRNHVFPLKDLALKAVIANNISYQKALLIKLIEKLDALKDIVIKRHTA